MASPAIRRISLLVCALASACTGQVSGSDGSFPDDAGLAEDAGARGDDAGVPIDAGADAGTDAGTRPDAGSPTDAGAAGCPPSAIFCESFEDGGLDGSRWIINGDATTFSIDTAVPARDGHASLHMAYGKPYGHTGQQTVQIRAPLAAPDDRIFVRAWLRFGNLGLPGAHPYFIDVTDGSGTELGFGSIINDFSFLAFVPGALDFPRIWYEGGGGYHNGNEDGDATPTSENGLTAGSWFCVELMFFGDHQGAGDTQHPGEEVKVWIDGVEIPQMGATDAVWQQVLGSPPPEHWSPVYSGARWRFGAASFGPVNVALDLWFDAIVLSPERIGCQP
jgi:hypothetical protein